MEYSNEAEERYRLIANGLGRQLNSSPAHTLRTPVSSTSCNCMYGPTDPRCCIARAQRRLLEQAWEMGRRGEPLPEVRIPADAKLNISFSADAKLNISFSADNSSKMPLDPPDAGDDDATEPS